MDDYSSFKSVDPTEISTTKTKTGVRRGGTARELQMARAMGQQVPFTPAPVSADSSGAAFMTGVGRGASLGLSDYLAALGIQGTRAMTGGAPVTFQEALGDVRGFTQQMREESPIAYGAGQVFGSVGGPGALTAKLVAPRLVPLRQGLQGPPALKPAVAPGLGTIAGMAGTGAVTGGISGFTEGDDLGQAAAGAGLGAATGGLVGGAFQGGKKLVDKIARENAARTVEKLLTSKQAGNRETLENLFGVTDKQFRKEGTTVFKEGKNLVDALRSGEISAAEIPQFVNFTRQLAYKSPYEHLMNIGEAGVYGVGAGSIGAGLAALSGGFIPPATAAAGIGLYGAKSAAGRALTEGLSDVTSRLATRQVPTLVEGVTKYAPRMSAIDETAARLAGTYQPPRALSTSLQPTPSATGTGITGTVSPMMGSMVPAQPEDYSEFVPVEATPAPAATAPMPRLRQLAEEFRQRTGGQ